MEQVKVKASEYLLTSFDNVLTRLELTVNKDERMALAAELVKLRKFIRSTGGDQ